MGTNVGTLLGFKFTVGMLVGLVVGERLGSVGLVVGERLGPVGLVVGDPTTVGAALGFEGWKVLGLTVGA